MSGGGRAPVVDAHQHFWRIDAYDSAWMTGGYEALRRDFLPEHLQPHLRTAGVGHSVFVQAHHSLADNLWVLELARRHDWIAGVVGWLDMTSPDFERQLVEHRRHERFCGVRHLIHNEPDDDWVLRDDVQRSLRVLERHSVPFDLLFFVRHLRHAATLAQRFPGLPLVVDHLAKPHIAARRIDDWLPALRAAARHPRVHCKLSGMVTEADWRGWQPSDLEPYVRHALDCFGPARCMFGSDWPVCEVAAPYSRVHAAMVEIVDRAGVTGADRDAVFGTTAARFYGLRLS